MPRTKSTTAEPKSISYEDLPLKTRTSIDKIIEYRKTLDLPDDSEDRKERAVKYFQLQQEKTAKQYKSRIG